MKPDFALSLSHQGVRLFHRAADGWNEVGTVPVDSADLAADLAALRAAGLALAPAGDGTGDSTSNGRLDCKLVMPNDLVRYLALDNPRASEADIRAALERATPYALADLAHDHRAGGGRMHIAAVARENLDEAEAFAIEHGFAPLAFVATPEPWTFPGEVMFGPTRLAAAILPEGVAVAPEDEGVPVAVTPFVEIGVDGLQTAGADVETAAEAGTSVQVVTAPEATTPEAGPADATAPVTSPVETNSPVVGDVCERTADDPAAAAGAEAVAAIESAELAAQEDIPISDQPEAAPATDKAPAADDHAAEAPEIVEEAPFIAVDEDGRALTEPPPPPPPPAPDTGGDESKHEDRGPNESGNGSGDESEDANEDGGEPAPVPVFASRARPQGIVPVPPPPLAPPVVAPPGSTAPADTAAPGPEPVFASRSLRAASQARGSAPRREPLLTTSGGKTPAADTTATPPLSGATTGQDKAQKEKSAAGSPGRISADVVPLAAPPRPIPPPAAAKATAGTAPVMPGQHAARGITAPEAPDTPRAANAGPRRHRDRHGGKRGGRFGLGLMLTLLLLALLAAVALWSTTLDGGFATLFDREAPTRSAAAPADATADATPATPIAAAGEVEPVATSGLEPAGAGPDASSLSPEFAGGPEPDSAPDAAPGALTGGDPSGADIETAGAAPGLGLPEDESGLGALPEGTTESGGGALVTRGETRDAGGSGSLAALAGAAAVGALVTPEEADRIYQSTGVWLRAPRLPLLPRTGTLDDLGLGAADPARDSVQPVALEDGPGLAPDPGLPAQPVPPPAGTTISRDSRGLISATPEGVLLPTGITIFAGQPPRQPPTRPGTEPPPVDAADVIAESGIRPPLRPDSVTEAAIDAGLAEPSADDSPAAPEAEAETDGPATEGEDAGAEADSTTGRTTTEDSAAVSAGGVGLALVAPDLRPQLRPDSVVPPPAWHGKMPPNRPAGFAALAAEEPAESETSADPVEATLEAIASAPDPLAGVTARAVPQALRPDARPRNFGQVVQTQTEILARASTAVTERPAAPEPAPEPTPEPAPAATAAASPDLTREEAAEASAEVSSVAAPAAGPTPGGVASAATVARAINLREVNLIGVFGPQSARRALVRLANGRMVRVGVGDSLDGGQVVAIGDGFLNYNKRGQTYSLRVPG